MGSYFEYPDTNKNSAEKQGLGAVMALKVNALNGKPLFVVERATTQYVPDFDAAKTWTEKSVKDGSQLVFQFGPEGWCLLGMESDFNFSKDQIRSFFPQKLLQELWMSHHPVSDQRKRYFQTLRGSGLN